MDVGSRWLLAAPGLAALGTAGAGAAMMRRADGGGTDERRLVVGEATVDTTPALGLELAGFHRPPESPRLIEGVRQVPAARAIVIGDGSVHAALVSLDVIAVSAGFSRETARAVEARTGIPADHVRICATHTHSMPTLRYMRQWGRVSDDYGRLVRDAIVDAVAKAWDDRAVAELLVGSSRVEGGNSNRTVKRGEWRTDAEFSPAATDADRWLDTLLHVLVWERKEGKPPLIAYHFSAHPVCFHDALAGPDWPGLVAETCRTERGVVPVFLQGHIGDVNPGDGTKWIGEPAPTAAAIWKGLERAIEAARPVTVDRVSSIRRTIQLPLDLERYRGWLEEYRAEPARCTKGPWVDAAFAAEWFAAAEAKQDVAGTTPAPLSALRVGPVSFLFHPAELYSFYGLDIRHAAPADVTLCVGYTDDFVGYLTDPRAFAKGEYAALTVPKIVDLPPFTEEAGRGMATASKELLAACGRS